MDLNHLHIATPDLEATVEFYKNYFDFHEKRKLESGNYFIFNRKGFMIALVKSEAKASLPEWYHHGFRLAEVSDVEALHSRLRADGHPIRHELQKFDDYVTFTCEDPGGFPIEVYWEPGPLELRV